MIVRDQWNLPIRGTPMYRLVTKLKHVKLAFLKWHQAKPKMSVQISETRSNLEDAQKSFVTFRSPSNLSKLNQVKMKIEQARDCELSSLNQKIPAVDLNLKDMGSRIFDNSVKLSLRLLLVRISSCSPLVACWT